MASYSTVSLVLETQDVMERFVNYYRSAGAGGSGLLDGKHPPFSLDVPEVVLIECDAAFWSQLCGERPEILEVRQSAVFAAGLARCRSEWLLVVDADEFVFGDRAIPDFLAEVPDTVDAVSLPTAEAVWGPGDELGAPFGSTHFRLTWPRGRRRLLKRLIYGDVARYLPLGLAGHAAGKEFIRTGRSYSLIRTHDAQRAGNTITRWAADIKPSLGGMFLGHYDAIGLERWQEKWHHRNQQGNRCQGNEGCTIGADEVGVAPRKSWRERGHRALRQVVQTVVSAVSGALAVRLRLPQEYIREPHPGRGVIRNMMRGRAMRTWEVSDIVAGVLGIVVVPVPLSGRPPRSPSK